MLSIMKYDTTLVQILVFFLDVFSHAGCGKSYADL